MTFTLSNSGVTEQCSTDFVTVQELPGDLCSLADVTFDPLSGKTDTRFNVRIQNSGQIRNGLLMTGMTFGEQTFQMNRVNTDGFLSFASPMNRYSYDSVPIFSSVGQKDLEFHIVSQENRNNILASCRFSGTIVHECFDDTNCPGSGTCNKSSSVYRCEYEICEGIQIENLPTMALRDATITGTVRASGANRGYILSGYRFSGTISLDPAPEITQTVLNITGSFDQTSQQVVEVFVSTGSETVSCSSATIEIVECFTNTDCPSRNRCVQNSCQPRQSDFSGHKKLLTNPVYSGQDIVYEIFYENLGPDTGDLVIVERGGTGMILSGDVNPGRQRSGSALIYEIFGIGSGESGSVIFT